VFARDEWYAPGHAHGRYRLDAPLALPAHAVRPLVAGGGDPPDPARVGYFDIETTGLSGGTGTYVVIAGLGTYEPEGFRLRQYFLADVGHERAMLAMLAADIARCDALVTYNGRAFDVPCIESRLALARLPSPCDGLAHIDLLHSVRRLYKHRMPGCRLAEAERRLLRLDRPDDIPGWLIPSLYFDYVRTGRAAPLRAVMRHNADDVLSLAGVLAATAALFIDDDLAPEDAVAVARWCERDGDATRAMTLYERALRWLEGEPDWPWAAARLATLYRRAGRHAQASAIWQRLWEAGDADAGLALAKHHEHRTRDHGAAHDITAALIERCGDADGALAKRAQRLLLKLRASI
jgi:uncharacterized protein YprB with RNaseH-like and TPR domain